MFSLHFISPRREAWFQWFPPAWWVSCCSVRIYFPTKRPWSISQRLCCWGKPELICALCELIMILNKYFSIKKSSFVHQKILLRRSCFLPQDLSFFHLGSSRFACLFFSNNHGQKATFRTTEDKINSVPDESVHIQTVRDWCQTSASTLKVRAATYWSVLVFISFCFLCSEQFVNVFVSNRKISLQMSDS